MDASAWRIALALVAVWSIWSSTYLGIRIVVLEAPVMLSSGSRFALAGAALLAIGLFRGEKWPTRAEALRAIPSGVLLFAGGNGLVALAERTASSGAGALAAALSPVWAALMGMAFGERPTRRQWLGFAVGFTGVAILVGGDALPDRRAALSLAIAPVCWATGTVLVRRLPSRPSLQLFMGGIAMLLLGLVLDERVGPVSSRAVLAWIYLTTIGSMLAFTAYAYLVRNASTTVAMSYAYVNPVLAVLLGAALGGEHVSRGLILSAMLVVTAIVLIVFKKRQ